MACEPAELPKFTPYLLGAAESMCPRRLALELEHAPATSDPVNLARARSVLLDSIRTWHATGTWPPTSELFAEERAVIAQATRWYAERFPDAVHEVSLPVEEPTVLPRRQVRLGGWVDLGVVRSDGTRELRQLSIAGRARPADLLELPAVKLAVLRLAVAGWTRPGPLLVTWTDLLTGVQLQAEAKLPDDLDPLSQWLDRRLARAQARANVEAVEPGASCATCHYVPRCPAHDVAGSMTRSRSALIPGVLSVSPTSLASWNRCTREWRNRSLLRLAPSNVEVGSEHGLFLHQLLHHIHRHGSCHDEGHVRDVLAGHGADERTTDEVARHATRCPIGAEAVGHEIEWARAHRGPPVFMATARLDAAWAHDGILDVRDYKTGRVASYPVAEDPRARLQAWVAAPHAAARGLRLQLRYEHLALEVVDDPDPWEPADDELAAIEHDVAAIVSAMRAEREFRGVADAVVCRYCAYRAVCDDSASPARPIWPQPGCDG